MSNDSASIQSTLNKAHNAVWEQDWTTAIESYQAVLVEDPNHLQGLTGLGLAYFQKRDFEPALKVFQQLTALNPTDPMPYDRIARVYERVGMLHDAVLCFNQSAELHLKSRDAERAIENYNDSLRLDPENMAARSRLGVVYEKLNRNEEAITEFIALAAIFQNRGDLVKAKQAAQHAIQIHPDSEEANKAFSLIENGQSVPLPERKKGGTGPVRMAKVRELEIPSEDESAHNPVTEAKLGALKELAGLLFENSEMENDEGSAKKRPPRKITMVTGMLSSRQEDQTRSLLHLSQFIDHQTSGDDNNGLRELERAIDLGLQKSSSDFLYGLMIRDKDNKKALGYLQRSSRNTNYALASYLIIAGIYQKAGQYKEASTNYLQALRLADATSVPEDQVEELLQLYDPIFESNLNLTQEKDLIDLCQAISSQLERNDWRAYLRTAREQLPQQPAGSPPIPLAEMLVESSSSQVIESLANIRKLVADGKLRTSMEEAYYALSYAPTYLPLHTQIGEILIAEGRFQDAIEKFLQVCSLYRIRGETAQAIRLLSRVTKLAPMDIILRTELLDLLTSINRVDDAIQQHLDIANIYYLLVDLDKAQESLQSALALSRQSSSARDWSIKILKKLADIELQKLNWKGAMRVYEQLRNLQPEDPAPREALFDLYTRINMPTAAMNELDAFVKMLESGNKHGEIENFIDRLLNERPENIDLQKRMVGYYVSIDKLPRAVEKLDAIAEKLLQEKNTAGAIATVQQIITLNPPNRENYEKVIEQIRNGKV